MGLMERKKGLEEKIAAGGGAKKKKGKGKK
jgi:hypothetical protein